MHYSKFIAFVMVSKVRIMVPTRLAGLPCWDGNFCPWDTTVAFSWFPEQNRAQCHALSLLGCGLGPLCILLQALGDFLSFLFIESSPCLQHPLCLELLPAVHSSVLCYWWLCISLSGILGAALLLGMASCPRLLRVLWGCPRSLSHGAQSQPGQRKRSFEQYN